MTLNSSSKDVTTSAKEEIPHLSPKPLTVTSTHVAPDWIACSALAVAKPKSLWNAHELEFLFLGKPRKNTTHLSWM